MPSFLQHPLAFLSTSNGPPRGLVSPLLARAPIPETPVHDRANADIAPSLLVLCLDLLLHLRRRHVVPGLALNVIPSLRLNPASHSVNYNLSPS